MITTSAVDDDSIEQFIDRVEQHPNVESATQRNGQRKVKVRITKDDDGNIPKPWADWDDVELVDGEYHAPDYVISKLAGGGHAPGDKYARCVGISAYCDVCDARPQSDDHGLCSSCKVQRGLLTGPAGEQAVVQAVHDDDSYGTMTDPDQVFTATADDDGILRATLEYRGETRDGQSLNANAHKVVRWMANGETGVRGDD